MDGTDKLELRSRWRYVDSAKGYGITHQIIHIIGINITTWSEISQENLDREGYTWFGTKDQFLKAFEYIGPPLKPNKFI